MANPITILALIKLTAGKTEAGLLAASMLTGRYGYMKNQTNFAFEADAVRRRTVSCYLIRVPLNSNVGRLLNSEYV